METIFDQPATISLADLCKQSPTGKVSLKLKLVSLEQKTTKYGMKHLIEAIDLEKNARVKFWANKYVADAFDKVEPGTTGTLTARLISTATFQFPVALFFPDKDKGGAK